MLTLAESRLCSAEIDTATLRDNARVLAAAGGDLPMLADVSADGHGHGAVQTAIVAASGGAAWLAVSRVADAVPLREAGIRLPILASLDQEQDPSVATALGVVLRGSPSGVPRLFDPGIALYGLDPASAARGLAPALRVTARVLVTKTIERGDGVSYGYTFRAPGRMNLAMVAIGYADGLDRRAGNVASMLLAGKQRTIVGRVAMNAAVLDLGDDRAVEGEEAVLFGRPGEPSVHGLADALGAGADEIVTVFGRSLPRSYR